MMTITQHHLIKVAEECAEISHRALKAARFGLDGVQENPLANPKLLTNRDRLIDEAKDLAVMWHWLGIDVDISAMSIQEMAERTARIGKYLTLSQQLGQVETQL